MLMTLHLKYIYNEQGEKESVVVPIQEWEQLVKNIQNEPENQPLSGILKAWQDAEAIQQHLKKGGKLEEIQAKLGIKLAQTL